MQIDVSQPKHSQAMVNRLNPRNKGIGCSKVGCTLWHWLGLVAVFEIALLLAMPRLLIELNLYKKQDIAGYTATFVN